MCVNMLWYNQDKEESCVSTVFLKIVFNDNKKVIVYDSSVLMYIVCINLLKIEV